ncbi:hypothetical protein CUJ84_Chr003044 [Rhizobium leguminosarum]|uniref:Uncharacterized protein n=1 Tax=Rhizobium leguminosarum TaxID=384 RepID=A0A2K9Z579_RHILE|nr:hypothetical protein CUJ84_Chr003044 [Rhizobium leguminosarum]
MFGERISRLSQSNGYPSHKARHADEQVASTRFSAALRSRRAGLRWRHREVGCARHQNCSTSSRCSNRHVIHLA